ncbi:TPA: class II aldolase family protein [bacterium]|nr:class II aldolase family protein [bacterium]
MSKLGQVERLIEYSQLVYRLGLVWGTSGNMSLRLNKDRFIITASGASLGDLTDSDIVECSLDIEEEPYNRKMPSMEFRMHREIYRVKEEVSAILHAQPPFSTLVACSSDIELEQDILPESIAYLNKIQRVPYHHPGSMELAEEVTKQSLQADALLLENHGVICTGSSLKEVINKTETLEFLARLTVTAWGNRIALKVLPKDVADNFKQTLRGT